MRASASRVRHAPLEYTASLFQHASEGPSELAELEHDTADLIRAKTLGHRLVAFRTLAPSGDPSAVETSRTVMPTPLRRFPENAETSPEEVKSSWPREVRDLKRQTAPSVAAEVIRQHHSVLATKEGVAFAGTSFLHPGVSLELLSALLDLFTVAEHGSVDVRRFDRGITDVALLTADQAIQARILDYYSERRKLPPQDLAVATTGMAHERGPELETAMDTYGAKASDKRVVEILESSKISLSRRFGFWRYVFGFKPQLWSHPAFESAMAKLTLHPQTTRKIARLLARDDSHRLALVYAKTKGFSQLLESKVPWVVSRTIEYLLPVNGHHIDEVRRAARKHPKNASVTRVADNYLKRYASSVEVDAEQSGDDLQSAFVTALEILAHNPHNRSAGAFALRYLRRNLNRKTVQLAVSRGGDEWLFERAIAKPKHFLPAQSLKVIGWWREVEGADNDQLDAYELYIKGERGKAGKAFGSQEASVSYTLDSLPTEVESNSVTGLLGEANSYLFELAAQEKLILSLRPEHVRELTAQLRETVPFYFNGYSYRTYNTMFKEYFSLEESTSFEPTLNPMAHIVYYFAGKSLDEIRKKAAKELVPALKIVAAVNQRSAKKWKVWQGSKAENMTGKDLREVIHEAKYLKNRMRAAAELSMRSSKNLSKNLAGLSQTLDTAETITGGTVVAGEIAGSIVSGGALTAVRIAQLVKNVVGSYPVAKKKLGRAWKKVEEIKTWPAKKDELLEKIQGFKMPGILALLIGSVAATKLANIVFPSDLVSRMSKEATTKKKHGKALGKILGAVGAVGAGWNKLVSGTLALGTRFKTWMNGLLFRLFKSKLVIGLFRQFRRLRSLGKNVDRAKHYVGNIARKLLGLPKVVTGFISDKFSALEVYFKETVAAPLNAIQPQRFTKPSIVGAFSSALAPAAFRLVKGLFAKRYGKKIASSVLETEKVKSGTMAAIHKALAALLAVALPDKIIDQVGSFSETVKEKLTTIVQTRIEEPLFERLEPAKKKVKGAAEGAMKGLRLDQPNVLLESAGIVRRDPTSKEEVQKGFGLEGLFRNLLKAMSPAQLEAQADDEIATVKAYQAIAGEKATRIGSQDFLVFQTVCRRLKERKGDPFVVFDAALNEVEREGHRIFKPVQLRVSIGHQGKQRWLGAWTKKNPNRKLFTKSRKLVTQLPNWSSGQQLEVNRRVADQALAFLRLATPDAAAAENIASLARPLDGSAPPKARRVKNVLVVMPVLPRLGDIMMTTPVVNALRSKYPKARIVVAPNPAFAEGQLRYIQAVYKSWKKVIPSPASELLKHSRGKKFDVCMALDAKKGSKATEKMISEVAAANAWRMSAFYGDKGRSEFNASLTSPVFPGDHIRYDDIVAGIGEKDAKKTIKAGHNEKWTAKRFLRRLGLRPGGYVVFYVGGTGNSAKRPPEYWEERINLALAKGLNALVLCGPGEEFEILESVKAIIPADETRVKFITKGQAQHTFLTVGVAHEIYRHAKAMESNDTGHAHIGDAAYQASDSHLDSLTVHAKTKAAAKEVVDEGYYDESVRFIDASKWRGKPPLARLQDMAKAEGLDQLAEKMNQIDPNNPILNMVVDIVGRAEPGKDRKELLVERVERLLPQKTKLKPKKSRLFD